jgi:hypothetical protein
MSANAALFGKLNTQRQQNRLLEQHASPRLDPQAPAITQSKVAIPQLQQNYKLPSAAKRRTNHACETCQLQKAKCSGGQPHCQRCYDLKLECHYTIHKRVQQKQ